MAERIENGAGFIRKPSAKTVPVGLKRSPLQNAMYCMCMAA